MSNTANSLNPADPPESQPPGGTVVPPGGSGAQAEPDTDSTLTDGKAADPPVNQPGGN